MKILSGLARRRALAILCVILFAFLGRIAILRWIPVPGPSVMDEFSYLLAGDTFASGRMVNPQHPHWLFFETPHVITNPVYASKYPPAQGAMLAVGKVLGHPWIGVLLSTSILCGVICWALQGWIPPGAALLGGLIAALRLGISGYWVNSYWGGSIGAIGGALLIGSLPRIARAHTFRNWIVFGTGLILLANTRPFEGLIFAALCGAYLLLRARRSWMPVLRSGIAPLLLTTAALAGIIGFYNYRVTGSPVSMPYVLYERQYSASSVFMFSAPKPKPVYANAAIQKFAQWEREVGEAARANPFVSWLFYLYRLNDFFLGGLIFLAALLPIAVKTPRRVGHALALLILFLGVLISERVILPHYASASAVLFFLLAAAGIHGWWNWNVAGRLVAALIVGGWTLQAFHPPARPDERRYALPEYAAARQSIEKRLAEEPGAHLVFVRYAEKREVHEQWVYNAADIDGSKIAWAWDRGPAANRNLIEYFRNRRIWIVETESTPVRALPYQQDVATSARR